MRVALVLRSAEVQPLVPGFVATRRKKDLVSFSPCVATVLPPPRVQHTQHTHTHMPHPPQKIEGTKVREWPPWLASPLPLAGEGQSSRPAPPPTRKENTHTYTHTPTSDTTINQYLPPMSDTQRRRILEMAETGARPMLERSCDQS